MYLPTQTIEQLVLRPDRDNTRLLTRAPARRRGGVPASASASASGSPHYAAGVTLAGMQPGTAGMQPGTAGTQQAPQPRVRCNIL